MRKAAGLAVAALFLLVTAGSAAAQTPSPPPSGPLDGERFGVSAEALVWWLKGTSTPPLVSTGALSRSGTSVVLGGDDIDTGATPGFRLTADLALTESWGLDGSFFYLPTRSTSHRVSSSGQVGSQSLFVPFDDVTIPGENVTRLSSPGFFSGSAREELSTSLLGAELNGTFRLTRRGPFRADLLGGFRYLRLKETYTFSTSSPDIPPQPTDVFSTRDVFEIANNFYGGQVGVRARWDWGSWFASGAVKVGLGAMVQSAEISGSLTTNDFNNLGAPQVFPGGYFAVPGVTGTHTRSVFAVVPEIGLAIGYQITPWASISAGYSFLYTNNVLRAPQQVGRRINPTGNPAYTGDPPAPPTGPAQPSYRFNSSDFWAQGVTVGFALRF